MDFGVSFLSNNVMLPFLDYFYGIVPSYGLAIVALTLVIRFLLFPVSANQLRSMRRMKIANPVMQKRVKEIQERYKDNPKKLQEEMARVQSENFKEFGNPLSGCLPALLQMPILFALFATLRGSPFADINYTVNVQVFDQLPQVERQAFQTPPQNVYFADRVHYPVVASLPQSSSLVVGEEAKISFQTLQGQDFGALDAQYPDIDLTPRWQVTKGAENVSLAPDGTFKVIKPGDVTFQGTIPGLASNKGFLFIQALGGVGVTHPDGTISWDILVMILAFGLSLYINQTLSGGSATPSPNQDTAQQDTMNKVTPVIFSGMFLFFPLPAGVLLYMLIANIFQTLQSFIVSREPLPENLQKLVEASAAATAAPSKEKAALPFEPNIKKNSKKKG
ncbi:MAG: membrane protein insertase YidC [Oscillatoriales cyanobacterium SM2_2_1]|nr:membrane protein insertase YidC [Oscillatoriales cyanobacterium SM2_2_1]